MERPNQTPGGSCGAGAGMLPGNCAPLAFPYIPMQEQNPPRFGRAEARQARCFLDWICPSKRRSRQKPSWPTPLW